MGINQTWNTSYEDSPASGDNPGGGDNAIRNLKTTIKNRLTKEHRFPTTNDELGQQGLHKPGSAFPFIADSAPQLRTDGTDFEVDIDEGRIWINTASNGRLYYLKSIDETTQAPTWRAVASEAVGKFAAFPSMPDVDERYTPCDGRTITKSDSSEDGEVGGYEALIDFLVTEADGDVNHPFYSSVDGNSAVLPDLRGVGLRGLDSFNSAGSSAGAAGRDTAQRENWAGDDVANSYSGSYQTDNITDHRHEMNHTHGAAVVDGLNEGSGRTGDPDWAAGDPRPDDETGNWNGDSHLNTNGVLTMRNPSSSDNQGAFSDNCANDTNVTVDLEHHHTIPGFYGRTHTFAEEAEDTLHGVPEPQDINYADEATMKNVAVYWFIKY